MDAGLADDFGEVVVPTSSPKLLNMARKDFCCACFCANEMVNGEPRVEAHHVLARGMGNAKGGDDWWNVIPLCTDDHTAAEWAWHRDLKGFFRRYPHVYRYLRFIGWEFIEMGYKLKPVHPAYVNLKPKEKPVWVIPAETIKKYLVPKSK